VWYQWRIVDEDNRVGGRNGVELSRHLEGKSESINAEGQEQNAPTLE